MSLARDLVWHDLECGAYDADLPLWRELAAACGGAVLDVGAGSGRVTLDLARRGHELVALDADPVLLDALAGRAAGLAVTTALADARELQLGERFALVIVPMQTIQLFGGRRPRMRFLERAAAHLLPGGTIAIAIADPLAGGPAQPWTRPPLPDIAEIDGVVYSSQAVMLHDAGHAIGIERVREVIDDRGGRESEPDMIWLDVVTAAELEQEGEALGLGVLPRREIGQTDDYVASTVVMLGG
jgi:SAM-dependent methyltransferase